MKRCIRKALYILSVIVLVCLQTDAYGQQTDVAKEFERLGLSIVYACAERLGSSLILDNTYQSGCRFVLTIPVSHQSE